MTMLVLVLNRYLQGEAQLVERLVVEHDFALFRLFCSVIACTVRHVHNENAGAGPWSLLACKERHGQI